MVYWLQSACVRVGEMISSRLDAGNRDREATAMDLTRHYIFDGGMGTMLQQRGLQPGEHPELLNLEQPEVVRGIHADYVAAGADIITTNTFGASPRKLGQDPKMCIEAAVRLAREAGAPLVALDIGPTGAMLQPLGDLSFDEAYDQFACQVRAGAAAGADLVVVETMSDLLEAKAALLAAKENCDLPVFVTVTFSADGRTFLGTEPKTAAVVLTALGADAVGINCSLGPQALVPLVREMLAYTHLPVVVQPNAGLPRVVDGKTTYDITPAEFAACAEAFLEDGAAILGGCCGTTPAHIRLLKDLVAGRKPVARHRKGVCRLAGWQKVLDLSAGSVALAGNGIGPAGGPEVAGDLMTEDWESAAELAIQQRQDGAQALLVDVRLPDVCQKKALSALVQAVEGVSPLPLVLASDDPVALEAAVRQCKGRPMLWLDKGEATEQMLRLAARYGCAVAAPGEMGLQAESLGIPAWDFFAVVPTSDGGEAVARWRAAGLSTATAIAADAAPEQVMACRKAGLQLAVVSTEEETLLAALSGD